MCHVTCLRHHDFVSIEIPRFFTDHNPDSHVAFIDPDKHSAHGLIHVCPNECADTFPIHLFVQ